jgi:hypothetical protein
VNVAIWGRMYTLILAFLCSFLPPFQENNVSYKVDAPTTTSSADQEDGNQGATGGASFGASFSSSVGGGRNKCCVMEQKEMPDGLKDARCDREVPAGHAGLCV